MGQGTGYLSPCPTKAVNVEALILSSISGTINRHALVAQGIERRIPNPCAAGSIPARRTIKKSIATRLSGLG